jgi:hypothetical protein
LNSLTLVTIITDYKDADEYHLWYLSSSLYRTAMAGTGLDRIFGIQQIIHVQGSSQRAELNAIM